MPFTWIPAATTRVGGFVRETGFFLSLPSWWLSAVTSRETTKHRQRGVTREGHKSRTAGCLSVHRRFTPAPLSLFFFSPLSDIAARNLSATLWTIFFERNYRKQAAAATRTSTRCVRKIFSMMYKILLVNILLYFCEGCSTKMERFNCNCYWKCILIAVKLNELGADGYGCRSSLSLF